MKNTDLYAHIINILPDATFGDDNDGQLIIYTGMKEDSYGNILQFDYPEDASPNYPLANYDKGSFIRFGRRYGIILENAEWYAVKINGEEKFLPADEYNDLTGDESYAIVGLPVLEPSEYPITPNTTWNPCIVGPYEIDDLIPEHSVAKVGF